MSLGNRLAGGGAALPTGTTLAGSGVGSPVGAVTAAPNAIYVQNPGPSAIVWVHDQSGTNNTGWFPVYSGAGSPEGAQSASPSDPYRRTSDGSLWVHRGSGAGTAGWFDTSTVIRGNGSPEFVVSAAPGVVYIDDASGVDDASRDHWVHGDSGTNTWGWEKTGSAGYRNPRAIANSKLAHFVWLPYGEDIAYTLSGTDITSFLDLSASGANATGTVYPVLNATGGPNSTPEADFGDGTARRLNATGLTGLGDESRPMLIVVGALPDGAAANRVLVQTNGQRIELGVHATDAWRNLLSYDAGLAAVKVANGSADAGDHVFLLAYRATANRFTVDGVIQTIESPPAGFTNGEAMEGAVTSIAFGHTSVAGGKLVGSMLFNDMLTDDEFAEIALFVRRQTAKNLAGSPI